MIRCSYYIVYSLFFRETWSYISKEKPSLTEKTQFFHRKKIFVFLLLFFFFFLYQVLPEKLSLTEGEKTNSSIKSSVSRDPSLSEKYLVYRITWVFFDKPGFSNWSAFGL